MKRVFLMLSATFIVAASFSTASLADDHAEKKAEAAVSLVAGDAVKGAKIFKKCQSCHNVDKDGKNSVGPNLFGVVGRKSASAKDYSYSDAMTKSDVTWDEASLNSFLKKPKAFVSGTKMSFVGLKKDKHRANVIAYLKTLK